MERMKLIFSLQTGSIDKKCSVSKRGINKTKRSGNFRDVFSLILCFLLFSSSALEEPVVMQML